MAKNAQSTDSIFPLILTRDLPVYSGTLGDGDYVLGLTGNEELRRLPVASLAFSAMGEVSTPSSPDDEGKADGIIWDENGVYTYLNGKWGKSPRLTLHWEDYGAQTRLLIVDKEQELDENEQLQGRTNLGIEKATQEKQGMVQIAESVDAGGDNVPTAQQVHDYVQQQMSKFGDKISNYQGEVHIHGPQGELILDYDSTTHVLTVGTGIVVKSVNTNSPEVHINQLNTIK